jgi:hypothetical protein
MTPRAIWFLTASATALFLYRALLMLGAENRTIFGIALLTAAAVLALWVISALRTPGGEAG